MISNFSSPKPTPLDERRVDTRWTVETPEGVDFHFELAGPGRRGLALAVDIAIIVLVTVLVVFFLSVLQLASASFSSLSNAFFLLLLFALKWFYSALFETFAGGRTPGKMIFKLRVLRSNGTPIGFLEAFGRGLLHAADLLPLPCFYTVGVLVMISNQKLQRLGDLFFDTMVIDESADRMAARTNVDFSTEPIPRASCLRSFHISPRTLTTIDKLFEHRRPISPLRREELAVRLANPISRILGYSPDLDPHGQQTGPNSAESRYSGASDPARYPATLFLVRVGRTFSSGQRGTTTAPKTSGPPRSGAADQPAPASFGKRES